MNDQLSARLPGFAPTALTLALTLAMALALAGCDQKTEEAPTVAEAESAPAAAVVDEPVESVDESERLNAWFDEKYEELLQQSPAQMTFLGRKDRYDEFDQFGEAAIRERTAWRLATVEEMRESFDYDALSPQARESWDLWVFQAEQAERGLEFMYHGYPFGELGGPEAQLPQFMINFHRVDTEADMRAYISRLREGARAMNQVVDMAKESASRGIRPPRFAFEVARERAEKVVTGGPFNGEEDSPIYGDVKRKIAGLV